MKAFGCFEFFFVLTRFRLSFAVIIIIFWIFCVLHFGSIFCPLTITIYYCSLIRTESFEMNNKMCEHFFHTFAYKEHDFFDFEDWRWTSNLLSTCYSRFYQRKHSDIGQIKKKKKKTCFASETTRVCERMSIEISKMVLFRCEDRRKNNPFFATRQIKAKHKNRKSVFACVQRTCIIVFVHKKLLWIIFAERKHQK